MSLPMIQVFLPSPTDEQWVTVDDNIRSMDEVEWFDDLDGWETKQAHVSLNGKNKICTIYLSADDRGWVNLHEFYPANPVEH